MVCLSASLRHCGFLRQFERSGQLACYAMLIGGGETQRRRNGRVGATVFWFGVSRTLAASLRKQSELTESSPAAESERFSIGAFLPVGSPVSVYICVSGHFN